MKRIISMLLAIVLIVSLAACGAPTNDPEATLSSEEMLRAGELERAVAYNFLEKTADPQTIITEKDFVEMLRTMIAMVDPTMIQPWDALTAGANSEPIHRDYGAMILLKAAELIGATTFTNGSLGYLGQRACFNGDAFYEDMCGNFYLFEGGENSWENICTSISEQMPDGQQFNYMNAAQEFTASRLSLITGMPLLDFFWDTGTMKLTELFTLKDAALAVTRLYESIDDVASGIKGQVKMPNFSTTVSLKTLELAEAMPVVAYDNLPTWRGYTVAMRESLADPDSASYTESEIAAIAQSGFNYVRIPLRFENLFFTSSTDSVIYYAWEELDTLLEYCAKYGLHISFELHDMLGFTTGGGDEDDILFEDTQTQERFAAFWRSMAIYFKDIPENLLSFILLTEPHTRYGMALTDELYTDVMKKAIHEIRDVSPDRLIIVSGVGVKWAEPCYGLVDERVVQGTSAYILNDESRSWPSYCMAKNHESAKGDIVLTGNFCAGTKLSVSVMQYLFSDYHILGDGKELASFRTDGDIQDGTGLTVYTEEADVTWRGASSFGWYTVTVTLPEDCTELRLHETEGYYELYMLALENEDWSISIGADDNFVTSQEPPHIVVGTDGTLTALPTEALQAIDRNTINQRLARYADFTKETGVPFMVLEFGFNETIASEVALAAADDFLSLMDEYKMNWISWLDAFGPIINIADVEARMARGEPDYRRPGATYVPLCEQYWIDPALMEVYSRYMK